MSKIQCLFSYHIRRPRRCWNRRLRLIWIEVRIVRLVHHLAAHYIQHMILHYLEIGEKLNHWLLAKRFLASWRGSSQLCETAPLFASFPFNTLAVHSSRVLCIDNRQLFSDFVVVFAVPSYMHKLCKLGSFEHSKCCCGILDNLWQY